MPLQNRVTPFGEIVALPQRGLFTGNRGIIHDPATKTLLRRRWTTKAWLICTCDYRGIRRTVMGGRSWTELFFLDEATALAAGHRPCFLCRRAAALRFRDAWMTGNGGMLSGVQPRVPEIDGVLHAERLRHHALRIPLTSLPDGAMVAAGEMAFLVKGGVTFLWSMEGYRPAPHPPRVDRLLTPPSTLEALKAGYLPVLHPSIGAQTT